MSDGATASLAFTITIAHVAIFVVAWLWAIRSRHLGFLALIVPVAVAWVLAGYPLVRDLTYGTAPFAIPKGGLQAAGFTAILVGFVGFFVCAVGTAVTLVMQGARRPR